MHSAIAARLNDSIVLPDLFAKPRNGDVDLYDVHGGGYEMREDEIAIDLFCGAGGTSEGVRQAIGESPMFALNHNPVAIGVHDANHPDTIHLESDVFAMDPAQHVPLNKRVGLLCASPSCVHFSTARGGKPVDREIRDQAWVVCQWAEHPVERFRPRVITVENVREFLTWCPVDERGKIIKRYIDKQGLGSIFKEWRSRLIAAGYQIEFKILNAADYGVATKRRRLLIVARRDGLPIRFPEATHGPRNSEAVKQGLLKPYATAAEHIDFSIQANPIFMYPEDAKAVGAVRPLADNTLRRVAAGVEKFVIEAAEPYIIPYYGAKAGERSRARPVSEPLPTQSTENRFAFVNPVISPITHTGAPRYYGMDNQLPTLTCAKRGELALISPICSMGPEGAAVIPMRRECSPVGMSEPLPALATHSQMALAVGGFSPAPSTAIVTDVLGSVSSSAFIVGAGGGEYAGKPRTANDAINTITCHSRQALVVPSLIRVNHGDVDKNGKRRGKSNHDLQEPLPTQPTSNEFALVSPRMQTMDDRAYGAAAMVTTGYGERDGQAPRCLDVQEPIGTFVASGGKHAVVEAGFLRTGVAGLCTIRTDMHKSNATCAFDPEEPFNALTTTGGFGVVKAGFITNNNTNRLATSAEDPIPAMTTGNQQIVTEVGLMRAVHVGEENFDDAGNDARDPFSTMTLSPHQSIVTSGLAVHIGQNNFDHAGQPADEPMTTMTQTPQQVVVQSRLAGALGTAVFMAQNNAGKIGHPVTEPVSTMTTSVSHQSVIAGQLQAVADGDGDPARTAVFMAQHNADNVGHPVTEPVSTMTTAVCHQNVVASHIMTLRQNTVGQDIEEPITAFCAAGNHHAEVRTCLVKYYGNSDGQDQAANDAFGTFTTKDRFAVVHVPVADLGLTEEQRYEAWWIARFLEVYGTKEQPRADLAHLHGPRPSVVGRPGAILWTVEMRMLVPKEAFSASSFPADYQFERMSNGKATTKTQQMALVGNAVPPGLAKAIIGANCKPKLSLTSPGMRMAA